MTVKSIVAGSVVILDLNGMGASHSEVAEGDSVVGMYHLNQGTYLLTIELSNGKWFMNQLVKM